MPKAVEGYVFSDSKFANSLFQRMMVHRTGLAFEYFSSTLKADNP